MQRSLLQMEGGMWGRGQEREGGRGQRAVSMKELRMRARQVEKPASGVRAE